MTLLRDIAVWLFCWACYHVYIWTPVRIMPLHWELALLPWAGLYGYSESWDDFRETCAWNRAGRPADWQWGGR